MFGSTLVVELNSPDTNTKTLPIAVDIRGRIGISPSHLSHHVVAPDLIMKKPQIRRVNRVTC